MNEKHSYYITRDELLILCVTRYSLGDPRVASTQKEGSTSRAYCPIHDVQGLLLRSLAGLN